ncbi:hypothetical protein D3C72_1329550 [compost metagenome]
MVIGVRALGHLQLSQQDRARVAQAADNGGVMRGGRVAMERHAGGGGYVFLAAQVF